MSLAIERKLDEAIQTLINYDFYFLEFENHIELKNGILFIKSNMFNFVDKDNFYISSRKINDIIGVLELKYSNN